MCRALMGKATNIWSARENHRGWDGMQELRGLAAQRGKEGGSEALEDPSRCLSGCEVQGYDEPSSREND